MSLLNRVFRNGAENLIKFVTYGYTLRNRLRRIPHDRVAAPEHMGGKIGIGDVITPNKSLPSTVRSFDAAVDCRCLSRMARSRDGQRLGLTNGSLSQSTRRLTRAGPPRCCFRSDIHRLRLWGSAPGHPRNPDHSNRWTYSITILSFT